MAHAAAANLFRSQILSLAWLIGISASLAFAVTQAYADEGSLFTIAAKRFQNLAVTERRPLEYADVSNPHRGEFRSSDPMG